jgi:hypothetical protein
MSKDYDTNNHNPFFKYILSPCTIRDQEEAEHEGKKIEENKKKLHLYQDFR